MNTLDELQAHLSQQAARENILRVELETVAEYAAALRLVIDRIKQNGFHVALEEVKEEHRSQRAIVLAALAKYGPCNAQKLYTVVSELRPAQINKTLSEVTTRTKEATRDGKFGQYIYTARKLA